MNPIIILGALGLGAAALLGGKKDANASAAKPGVVPGYGNTAVPSDSILTRITAAVASGDPKKMRAEAKKLRNEGYTLQADDLEKAATAQENMNAVTQPTNSAGTAPAPISPSLLPPVTLPANPLIPTMLQPVNPASPAGTLPSMMQPVNPGTSSGGSLAADMSRMLTATGPYKEDKKLVAQFQASEGVAKPDGLYGPSTAEKVMKYDLVPVKPFYWSKDAAKAKTQKAAWKALMNKRAKSDPSRAAEWKAAGRV